MVSLYGLGCICTKFLQLTFSRDTQGYLPPTKAATRACSERFGVFSVSLVKIVGNGRISVIAKENLFSSES